MTIVKASCCILNINFIRYIHSHRCFLSVRKKHNTSAHTHPLFHECICYPPPSLSSSQHMNYWYWLIRAASLCMLVTQHGGGVGGGGGGLGWRREKELLPNNYIECYRVMSFNTSTLAVSVTNISTATAAAIVTSAAPSPNIAVSSIAMATTVTICSHKLTCIITFNSTHIHLRHFTGKRYWESRETFSARTDQSPRTWRPEG